MERLKALLTAYAPCDAQEASDREMMLEAIERMPGILTRENRFAHFTASSWIVNPARTKVLMAFHNIYKSWAWTGGHADGDADLLAVALREAREETGVERIAPVSTDIYSVEIVPVNWHIKRGAFVSSHLHMNVSFLLTADDGQPLRAKPDENSAVAWMPLEEAADNKEEPIMKLVYEKLNRKLERYRQTCES